MRSDLFTHPKVVRMSSALKADKCPDVLRVVGGLMSVWCLFDAHSVDGALDGYTLEVIDEHVRWPGFASQMKAVGWLIENAESLMLPEFDTHNGLSAKRRAQDADRKRTVRTLSASEPDKKRTRGEERREEITPPTPKGEPVGFEEFWAAWPASVRKEAKGKCLEVWKKNRFERVAAEVIRHLDSLKTSTAWTKSGGEFIPAPLVYLNQRRWEGAEDIAPQGLQLIGGI